MLKLDERFFNPVKKSIKEDKKVCGAWLQLASTMSAEIMGKAEFDFLIVDMEHGPSDYVTLIAQLQAMKGYGTVPFARAPWNDFVAIKRILDAGVYGLLVPYVNTKEEAALAVAATKYPPEGIRGVAPSPRAPGFGMNSNNYMQHANDEILVMTAIETPEAVQNIDDILTTKGLDGIFIGPMDLATSMGHFCNPGHADVQAAISAIEQKVLASDKFLATVAGDFDTAQKLYQKGYSLVICMSDSGALGKMAMDMSSKFKSAYR